MAAATTKKDKEEFEPTPADLVAEHDEVKAAQELEHSSGDLTDDHELQAELNDMKLLESLEEVMERDPGVIGRLRNILGISASPLPTANTPAPRTTAEIASSYPVNSVEMGNMDIAKAAKLTDMDKDTVLSYSVRGNVADENGVITDTRMFVTVVTTDGKKHARQLQGPPVRG